MAAKVYILILNWNNWRDTVECLESVYQSSYRDCQVVVVDNGSTDGSEERVMQWAEGNLPVKSGFFPYRPGDKPVPCIRYDRGMAERGGLPEEERALYASLKPPLAHPLVLVQTGENLGYAGGNNVGIRYAMGKGDGAYVWLLNNDTVVAEDSLREMLACAEGGKDIGMVGSRLLYYHETGVLQLAGGGRIIRWMGNASVIGAGERDGARWDRPLEPDYIAGASLLLRLEVVEAIGLIDERYFLYWEDADWGVRAKRGGYRLLYCPSSVVRHKEGGTAGRFNPIMDYYWVRNGLMFARRFYPWSLPFVFTAYLAKYTLLRTIRRQPRNFGACLRGMFDFMRGRAGRLS